MSTLNEDIGEYSQQLQKGQIQRAYKGIMEFMSGLKAHLEHAYPKYSSSAMYFGYMDMTYFAFTPPQLKDLKLKIAVVYLHAENRFECWLAGSNRKVQAEYLNRLSGRDIGNFSLSMAAPGVDSIIEWVIAQTPDFDNANVLKAQLEEKIIRFISDIKSIIK